MAFCIGCGTEIREGYEFCPECGMKISTDPTVHSFDSYGGKLKTCGNCGERMSEDAFYCLGCGMTFDNHEEDFESIKKRVSATGKPQKRIVDTSVGTWKNKWVALVLCLFFGVFGVHRFYEEKKISGFLYLFTFGLFGYGVFFDLILLATKPNPYREK